MTRPTDQEADDKFFADADADPNCVYLVTMYPEGSTAVFSTRAKAQVWVATFPVECPVIFTTRVIDEPDYGNVRAS